MDVAVKKFRERRDGRLAARGVRKDDVEENTNNRPGEGSSGGHGNTKLPFGLCKKYGIEYGEDWSPRDAWDALANKGVTPGDEYARLSGKGTTLKTKSGTEYRDLRVEKSDRGLYRLSGEYDKKPTMWTDYKPKAERSQITTFLNHDEMVSYLKSKGITRFKDPDTGENINPQKMDAPKIVATVDEGLASERRYKDLALGMVILKSGPFSGPGYTITGKNFRGNRDRLKTFGTEEEARKYAKSIGCAEEDLRETPDFKKWGRHPNYLKKGKFS